jgi:hypothetical protein
MPAGELRVQCRTCGRAVIRSPELKAPFFPFCSERCKLTDLGKWFDEKHRIPEDLEPGAKPPAEQDKEA